VTAKFVQATTNTLPDIYERYDLSIALGPQLLFLLQGPITIITQDIQDRQLDRRDCKICLGHEKYTMLRSHLVTATGTGTGSGRFDDA
jgi:hypothetical protein